MTVEVGIINSNGVVLAADSAATVKVAGKLKFIMTDKLFDLSKHHSVGIMIYENAYFTNIPWETVIKVYRSYIKETPFSSLQEYADFFLKFLIEDKRIYDSSYENKLVESVCEHCLKENGIELKLRQEQTLNAKIEDKIKSYSEEKFLYGFDDAFIKLFIQKHTQHLKAYLNDNVNISIDNKTQENIILLCAYTISKSHYLNKNMPSSGVVIAGYGNKEIFPSLNEYKIIGIVSGKLIYTINSKVNNSLSNIYSLIMPFAQRDVIDTYTSGIDTDIKNVIFDKVDKIFNNLFEMIQTESDNSLPEEFSVKYCDIINATGQKLKNQIINAFNSKQKEKYTDPFTSMVDFLGKEEMASLAEALVNMTSTRHRYTTDIEDVGGATDLAIITKGEGFVWIKRKEFINSN